MPPPAAESRPGDAGGAPSAEHVSTGRSSVPAEVAPWTESPPTCAVMPRRHSCACSAALTEDKCTRSNGSGVSGTAAECIERSEPRWADFILKISRCMSPTVASIASCTWRSKLRSAVSPLGAVWNVGIGGKGCIAAQEHSHCTASEHESASSLRQRDWPVSVAPTLNESMRDSAAREMDTCEARCELNELAPLSPQHSSITRADG
eukprot:5166441-Prymnesium_polylepis.1